MVAKGGASRRDESRTIKKRFDAIGVYPAKTIAATIARCCSARTACATISGVILYDETIRQKAGRTPLVKLIAAAGSLPASRSTKERSPAVLSGEVTTEGLDGLPSG
jgi:fructose-bisphosphate aldolase class I